MATEYFDLVIVGGGVIGCALARASGAALKGASICLLEAEDILAAHQSGRNSGVTHVGYNQKPGTLKSRLVVAGSRSIREYCRAHSVTLVEDGIVVVAKSEREVQTLEELCRRGQSNGAIVRLIDRRELLGIEPQAAGIAALHAPEGASFDARGFVLALAQEAGQLGVQICTAEPVLGLKEDSSGIEVLTKRRCLKAGVLVNAGGIFADRLAHQLGVGLEFQMMPFRGGYYELVPERRQLVNAHIYPCPDLSFPFLGVHLSKTFDGRVLVGPGAVLAMGRKAYGRFDFDAADMAEMMRFPGFWKLCQSKDFRNLLRTEWEKALFGSAVLREAQQLVPQLKPGDIESSRAGIRAQLVSRAGTLVEDLVVEKTARSIHVLNAVSPALTCSMPFADNLLAEIQKTLEVTGGVQQTTVY